MQESGFPFESSPRRIRTSRRVVSWWLSLILVVAIIALLGTLLSQTVFHESGVSGIVFDAYTLTPIAGATVVAGQRSVATNSDGTFHVGGKISNVAVKKNGFDPAVIELTPGVDQVRFSIRPNIVQGQVTSTVDHMSVAGATVAVLLGTKVVQSVTTNDSGMFSVSNVPDGASLTASAPNFAASTVAVDRRTEIEVQVRPDALVGIVTDQNGTPIPHAVVAVGNAYTFSGADGTYRLKGVAQAGTAYFKASGYTVTEKPLNPALHLDASLTRISVDALYATAQTAGDPKLLEPLINTIDTTSANALVVDLKDSSGHVYYDSHVPLAHEINAISPILNPEALVKTLHQHNIYAIARIVVFEDPILAEARPDLAIHDSATGGLWRTWDGEAWVNAYRSEVWDYNIAIAKEAAAFGFDEIQLDYVQLPATGNLSTAEFGVAQTAQSRSTAIGSFLQQMYSEIAPTRAYLSANVSELTVWETGDGQIGQNLESMVKYLDYICPTLYPSEFSDGSMGFAIPNDHPYEVILWSLQNAEQRIPEQQGKLRPWLQDFSLGDGIAYGPDEVKRQIDATNAAGLTGWMIWNPENVYHATALGPN